MPLAKVYTEVVGVGMRVEHWEELKALLPDVGVGTALRDAALRAIGRDDLVIESQRNDSGHRARKSSPQRAYANIPVGTTRQQKAAIAAAARKAKKSVAALMHDALRAELGLSPVDAAGKGWVRGRRRE